MADEILRLKRDGVVVDREDTQYEFGRLKQTFGRPDELSLRRAIPFDDASVWENEERFSLEDSHDILLFDGVVKSNRRDGSAGRDDTSYDMRGIDERAEGVTFRKGGSARVVYNAPREDKETGDYNPLRINKTTGEIMIDVLNTMRTELAGIIGDGQPVSGYVAAEVAKLTVVPPKTVFDGCSVWECITLLMRYHPQFGTFVDHSAHNLRIVDLNDLEEKVITVGSDAVIGAHLNFTTDGCYTACEIEGAGELVDEEVTLTPAWNPALEDTWTMQRAYEEPETYGKVWRLFASPGGAPAPYRAVGDSPRIMVHISNYWQEMYLVLTEWADIDFETGDVLLPWLARQWTSNRVWQPAAVKMRYTFRYGPVTARWPRSGYTGTAYTNRGLTREKVIVDHSAMRVTVRGTISKVESSLSFRDFLIGLKPAELVGKKIQFDGGGGQLHTISANDRNLITLASEPGGALFEGNGFTIYVQDDTMTAFENGTISRMELRAREWLKARCNERYNGTVPLANVDLSVKLGQKVSFAGTGNAFYETLGATLVEVAHDFKRDRTELVLTSERTLGNQPVWNADLARVKEENDTRNLASDLVLLRRAVAGRRAMLFDGDRDPGLAHNPEEPVRSVGRLGDATLLRGDVKLKEDSESTPSLLVATNAGDNALQLSANFGAANLIGTVSLEDAVAGATNRVADAGHRHPLLFDSTLHANGNLLGHAAKEAFGPGTVPYGILDIEWDDVYGHVVDITTMGS